jgi:hypothetical protein
MSNVQVPVYITRSATVQAFIRGISADGFINQAEVAGLRDYYDTSISNMDYEDRVNMKNHLVNQENQGKIDLTPLRQYGFWNLWFGNLP